MFIDPETTQIPVETETRDDPAQEKEGSVTPTRENVADGNFNKNMN